MEPPIGYGLTHRSIFPESQFRTDGGSVIQRAGLRTMIDTSARPAALEAIPGYTVTRFVRSKPSSHGLAPDHQGHKYPWDRKAIAGRSRWAFTTA